MTTDITAFEFKTQPYDHQLTALTLSADCEHYALFMDMGTGKTKVVIDTAAYLYASDRIDTVVVVAPNGVHRNWVLNEIPVHMPDHIDYKAHFYQATGGGKKQKQLWESIFSHSGLKIFCFNIESASNKKGQAELKACVQTSRVLFAIDESQRIKTPGAKRTQFLVNLARHAEFRRLMSGSPITQSPLDFYAQFKFLDPTITGYTTYTAFRNHFAEIEQRRTNNNRRGYFEHVAGYKNIAELERRIAPHCYRVKKEDCLDLPDKVYEKVYIDLTAEQKRIYKQLLDESVAVLKDECAIDIPPELQGADNDQLMLFFASSKITAKNAMVKLLRLQQVLCGSLPDDEGNVTILDNNRHKVLDELVEDISGKIIIWARFRYDLAMIGDMLKTKYGDDCLAEFHGGVTTTDRMEGVRRFQQDKTCRFFLAQQHSGGTGLTLTAASDVIYYSNDFSLEARLQSEDRAHRIGQKNNVTYHDLIVQNTVDERILEALANKKQIADDFNYESTTNTGEDSHQVNDLIPASYNNEEFLMEASSTEELSVSDVGIAMEEDAWE